LARRSELSVQFFLPNFILIGASVAPAGKKPQNRRLSKVKYRRFAPRAMLPVTINLFHNQQLNSLFSSFEMHQIS